MPVFNWNINMMKCKNMSEKKVKQYGRRRQHLWNLSDNHPGKGYVNWWDVPEDSNKGRVRRDGRDEIKYELDEYYSRIGVRDE